MRYAIILAGGRGSRFWPLSSESVPKQLHKIYSSMSMLEETVRRVLPVIGKDNIYIATSRLQAKKVKNDLRHFGFSANSFFLEPEARNTFAPIAVLAKRIYSVDRNAIIAVFPSDHQVRQRQRFEKLLRQGLEIARQGKIVTFGIPPKSPETGYGDIKVDPQAKYKMGLPVVKFIEKPALEKAKRLLKEKSYYWNSGIFIFKAAVMLDEVKTLMAAAYATIMRIKTKADICLFWAKLPRLSVDYAVMEKSSQLVLLKADCGWLDLGSWAAIEEMRKKDKNGNIFKGKCMDIASKNTLVWSDNRLVATLGLENLIIVNTKDVLLVCSKDKAQEVRKLADLLRLGQLKRQA